MKQHEIEQAYMNELIDAITEQEQLYSFEHNTRNLEKIIEVIEPDCHGSIITFLSNNSGAQEAIIDWIRGQEDDEWKDNIREHIAIEPEFIHHEPFMEKFTSGDLIRMVNPRCDTPIDHTVISIDTTNDIVVVKHCETQNMFAIRPINTTNDQWVTVFTDDSEPKEWVIIND